MKEMGIEAKITLKHIVLGYKIDDKNYFVLNILLLVGFSIYKSYYRIYLNRKQSVLMLKFWLRCPFPSLRSEILSTFFFIDAQVKPY
jgi:hypothetical protein